MTKQKTLAHLFAILAQANLADTDQADAWQEKKMCLQRGGLFGFIYFAIEEIEPGAAEYWCNSGEWNQDHFDEINRSEDNG
tara:strand:+ start:100 stop:342 length:243 start_codon:yes stop_codon:yes gene_type:complete